MRKKIGYLVLLFALIGLLVACGGGEEETATPPSSQSPSQSPSIDSKPPEQLTGLDFVIEEAKKEGKLLFADSISTQEMMRVIEQFEAKYPFITVEHLSEGGNDVINRVRQETDSKTKTVDLYIGSVAATRQLADGGKYIKEINWKSLGIQESLILSNHQVKGLGVLTVLGYNSNLVSDSEVPKTWNDLLDPKWEGKLAVPVSGWGSIAADLAAVWGEQETETFTLALKNNVVNIPSTPEVAPRVAAGEYSLGVMRLQHARIQMNRGAPLKYVFLDPVPSPMLTWAIPENSENPHAAQLFVHWVTSEGSGIYEEATGRGNPWIEGSQAAKDVQGLNISAFDGDPSMAEARTRLEEKFSELIK